ncbi:MAG TPA: DUF1353 domain-containing protein [Meiothermus sp.]|nr:DUF1353 domain-containing protein [Meiothermus sp.]
MKPFAFQLERTAVVIPRSKLPPPVISYLGEGQWSLAAEYVYQDGGRTLRIPRGFVFDLASVPRFLWWLIAPFELSVVAPLVHDFLYRYRGNPPAGTVEPLKVYTRREADVLFEQIMVMEGVPAWRQISAYTAVRFFGFFVWPSI